MNNSKNSNFGQLVNNSGDGNQPHNSNQDQNQNNRDRLQSFCQSSLYKRWDQMWNPTPASQAQARELGLRGQANANANALWYGIYSQPAPPIPPAPVQSHYDHAQPQFQQYQVVTAPPPQFYAPQPFWTWSNGNSVNNMGCNHNNHNNYCCITYQPVMVMQPAAMVVLNNNNGGGTPQQFH